MANARFAWGIDIGNRALKAVKLVRDGDQLRIDDFDVIEHEQVLSSAGDNRPALIQSALANFVQHHQTKGGVVAVGVAGQSSFARFIKLPPIEPRKIPEIVRFEAIQQIPFPLEDVEWSYQLFQDPQSPDVEVGIFAMRKELVSQQIGYLTDIELNVQLVQMNPLAVYNAMYFDQRIKGTTMIVDLGAENTDLIIADGETVWLRSIPIGGSNFTDALVKAFKVSFQKAEELKRNAKTSKYARQIFQAMRPVFADLVSEIQRSIGFYASVHRDARIGRIVGLGGTFRLPGLQKYLQQNLQLEVKHISGFSAGAPSDGKLATSFNENLLALPAAYGLALQMMGQGKIQSSLLPETIRREQMWRDKTKWFAATAALFVAGTGIAYGSLMLSDFSGRTSEATQDAAVVSQTLSKAKNLDSQWSEVENRGSADRQRILNVESLTSYRHTWPSFLVDMYEALPKAEQPTNAAAIARLDRKQVFIDKIVSHYIPDLTSVLAISYDDYKRLGGQVAGQSSSARSSPYLGSMGNMPSYDPGAGMPGQPSFGDQHTDSSTSPRGYLVTITCITPNRDGVELVDKEFLSKLSALTAEKMFGHRSYYIARASIISSMFIRDDAQRLTAMANAYKAAMDKTIVLNPSAGSTGSTRGGINYPPADPYMDSGRYPRSGTPQVDNDAPYRDRVTGEDVRNDRIITALVTVVLDPPAPQPKAEDDGTH